MEEVLWVILIIAVVVAISLLPSYLIAKEFYRAARDKGYADTKYLWIAFWLGIVGYLLVIALPDRRGQSATGAGNQNNAKVTMQAKPVPSRPQGSVTAPIIKRTTGPWKCTCGQVNADTDQFCKNCGKYK